MRLYTYLYTDCETALRAAVDAACKRNFRPSPSRWLMWRRSPKEPCLLPEKGKKSSGVYLTLGHTGLLGF